MLLQTNLPLILASRSLAAISTNGSNELQMFQHFLRGPFESQEWRVADILQILHPLFGGVKTGGDKVAHPGEKLGRLLKLGLCLWNKTDVVANFRLLLVRQVGKVLFESLFGLGVQPDQSLLD